MTNAPPEVIKEKFFKESRDLCYGLRTPHPLDFYVDICFLAFSLITRGTKTEQEYFVDLLLNEYVSFLEEVINIFEERNRNTQPGTRGRYVGKVSFMSIVLDFQH